MTSITQQACGLSGYTADCVRVLTSADLDVCDWACNGRAIGATLLSLGAGLSSICAIFSSMDSCKRESIVFTPERIKKEKLAVTAVNIVATALFVGLILNSMDYRKYPFWIVDNFKENMDLCISVRGPREFEVSAKSAVCLWSKFIEPYYQNNPVRIAPLALSITGLVTNFFATVSSGISYFQTLNIQEEVELLSGRVRENCVTKRNIYKQIQILFNLIVLGCALGIFTLSFTNPGNPNWQARFNDIQDGQNTTLLRQFS